MGDRRVDTTPRGTLFCDPMNAEIGSQFRIVGLARSPDREGALAHLDADRGFALVARGSMAVTDVIDPTIWVREKLAVALAASGDSEDTALKRVIGGIRSIHAELMRRPERDRAWISAMVVLLSGDDGVAISAGDCPCFRYRDGLLSRLRRGADDEQAGPPKGALGSEPQVRIEVVPLQPRPGDLYLLSTRPLRDGELAALTRDLGSARDGAQLLRAGIEGSSDRGRVALRVLDGDEDATLAARAEVLPPPHSAGAHGRDEPDEPATLDIEPLVPESARFENALTEQALSYGDLESPESPEDPEYQEELGLVVDSATLPPGVPGAVTGRMTPEASLFEDGAATLDETEPVIDEAGPPMLDAEGAILEESPRAAERADEAEPFAAGAPPAEPRAPRAATLAPVDEERPWYEPLALIVGGALAIIALALLVRAILPGIVNPRGESGPPPAGVAPVRGSVDFLSDPPGATVRVDGVPLDGRTPIQSVALDAGIHRIELDWGPAGVWRDTLEIAAGTSLVVHPAIHGALSFVSSEPGRVLDVYLDGAYVGTTPMKLEGVVVGRHLVRFGGPGLAATAQEVDVLRDASVEMIGNPGAVPENGRLTVRSALLTDAGFEASRNEPVWVDGLARGATPLTLDLKPGTHSVRVVRRNFPAQVSILDVKPGGEHFVTAEFGARSEEPLRFEPPASYSISNPSPLTIALPEREWDPSMALWLYAAAPGGSFQAKRMTRLEEGERTFAALLPPEVTRNSARQVRFYFKATGTAGRELYSEIVTIPIRD